MRAFPMIIANMILGPRSHPRSLKYPTKNAAGTKPNRYPPAGRVQNIPDVPAEYSGNQDPTTTYRAMDMAPRRLPNNAPVNSTAKVCPVIGTGVNGSGIETLANAAVIITKATTRVISRSILYLNTDEGAIASTIVIWRRGLYMYISLY